MPIAKLHSILAISLASAGNNDLTIRAKGCVMDVSLGNVTLEPDDLEKHPVDGIYLFNMVGEGSDKPQQGQAVVDAEYIWNAYPSGLRGIRVMAETNAITKLIGATDDEILAEEYFGFSTSFSFEEAFKDALDKAPKDSLSDYFKFVVTQIGYEEGGFAEVHQLFVKIRRVVNGTNGG